MASVTRLNGRRIVLGVTGSIAAYKAVDLASKLTQAGALVDVVMTEAAQRFVTPLTFQAVTGRAVYTDLWQTGAGGGLPTHIAHVGLGEGADLLMIAPATAHTLAKLAHGLADDLLTVTALAARCPVMVAPAMDGGMYDHAAVQTNLATLTARGVTVVTPERGRFASGLEGVGRLPETPTLMGALRARLGQHDGALRGRHVVVTAGGTQEPLDPVRYITNRSSGKQGYALAQAALDAGAQVTLITTAGLPSPYGAQVVPVGSAAEMLAAVLLHGRDADALVMAAAVADFRAAAVAEHKIKKKDDSDGLTLELVRNPDILAEVARTKEANPADAPRVVVGFAAESQNLLDNAEKKLTRKRLDMIVANDILASDAGFSVETNRVTLVWRDGRREALPVMSKAQVAEAILARVADLLG
jgi:phosphopantothenoylcysteine decarboxylase/phosphopantothenate--cysteine ligase